MNSEVVGIKRRPAHHGQHLARVRVHGDHGAILVAQGLLCRALHVDVNRQLQILARDGMLEAEPSHLPAMAVHQHVARAVRTAQHRVVALLDPGTAHYVSWLVVGVLGLIQHVFADLARVADQVGRKAIARIEPALHVDRLQLGEFIAVRLDELLLIGGDVALQRQRLVLGRAAILHQHRADLVLGHMKAAGDLRQVRFDRLRLVGHEEAGDRRIVVHQQAAFAVKEAAPRRQDRHLADAIGLGQFAVIRRPQDL